MALRILTFLLVAMVALAVPSFAQLPQLPDPVCVPATVQSTPVLRNLQGAWGAHCLCATLHHSCLCIPQKPLLARILPPHQTNSTLQHDRHCVHTRAAAAVQAASPPYQEFLVLIRINSHPMCSHRAFPAPARSLCHPSATPSAGQTVPRPLLNARAGTLPTDIMLGLEGGTYFWLYILPRTAWHRRPTECHPLLCANPSRSSIVHGRCCTANDLPVVRKVSR